MARPRLEPARLTKVITCRLSAEAYERWRAKVRASGLGAGEFLRRAIVEDETTIVARRAPRGGKLRQADVARLVGQLARLGNNMNQLARSVNRAHLEGSVRDETFVSQQGYRVGPSCRRVRDSCALAPSAFRRSRYEEPWFPRDSPGRCPRSRSGAS